jgi:hypothetical protein
MMWVGVMLVFQIKPRLLDPLYFLDSCSALGQVYYTMNGGIPMWVHNYTLDPDDPQWEGVPLMLCTPAMLPPTLRHLGVCYKQTGERQPLLPFALQNRVSPLLTEHFRSLCGSLGLQPERNAKNRLDKRSYVSAVVWRLGFGTQEAIGIIDFYAAPPKSEIPDDGCDDELFAACQHLDKENMAEFERLRDKAERAVAAAVDEQNLEPYNRNQHIYIYIHTCILSLSLSIYMYTYIFIYARNALRTEGLGRASPTAAVRTAVEMRRPQADALPTPGASSSSGTILYYTILD